MIWIHSIESGAPDTVNLDTLDDVRSGMSAFWHVFNEDSPMPPAGLPAEEDLVAIGRMAFVVPLDTDLPTVPSKE